MSKRGWARLAMLGLATLAWSAAGASAPDEDAAKREARMKRIRFYKAAQSTISDITSAKADNTLGLATGKANQVQNSLNLDIQLPVNFAHHWSIVFEPEIPVSAMPALQGNPSAFGLGDMTLKAQLSPTHTPFFDWGAGPYFQFPTATNSLVLGKGKYAIGPKVTATLKPGKWLLEITISNLFSFAGDASRKPINQMKLEPKAAYNFTSEWLGWFLVTDPTIEANWDSSPSQIWQVPVGGGFGRFVEVLGEHLKLRTQWFYFPLDGNPATTAQWSWLARLEWITPKHY